MNQIRGLAGQNGGKSVATTATIVASSSKDISVTVWILSRSLVEGEDLVRVTNYSF